MLAGGLAGCAGTSQVVRPTVYDFGPIPALSSMPHSDTSQAQAKPAVLLPVVLAPVDASPAIDGTAVVYRLAYADAQQLRPYALTRWSATPALLLHQRLREHLSTQRAVLTNTDALAPVPVVRVSPVPVARVAPVPLVGAAPVPVEAPASVPPGSSGVSSDRRLTLYTALEEFTQVFSSPTQSAGQVRLRATLMQATSTGEKLVAQRAFAVQRPAASADAPGGVRALAQAADALAAEVAVWLAAP